MKEAVLGRDELYLLCGYVGVTSPEELETRQVREEQTRSVREEQKGRAEHKLVGRALQA